jgi:SAM-dependent methyltransferase
LTCRFGRETFARSVMPTKPNPAGSSLREASGRVPDHDGRSGHIDRVEWPRPEDVMSPTADLEDVPCLCGGREKGTVIEATDPIGGAVWTYRRCSACGLERLSPRPPITDMGRHYPDDYTPYTDPAPRRTGRADRLKRMVYETYFATPEERSAVVRRYRPALAAALLPLRQHSVLSFHPPALPRHVFELGSGTGADLLEFRDAGWEVSGCEPSSVAARAAAVHGIDLQVCNAEDAELPSNLSCVYMNNVFEHLHNPTAVLSKAHAALLPGGIVVVIVPNHASWAARMFGSQWPGYDPPRHIWGFTPASIRGVLERAGFENVSVVQKYPLSTYCWSAGLGAWRAPDGSGVSLRRRATRFLGRGLLLGGFLSAMMGSGDYIRVIARKP